MFTEKIAIIDEYEKLLYEIFNNSDDIRAPKLEDNERLKFSLILDFHFINYECVNNIIKFHKNDTGGLMPILARTLYENSISMTLIYAENEDNGAIRYLRYGEVEDYKMFLKYQQSNLPEFADFFLTTDELENAKNSYNDFKEKGFSLRDWSGKNLFDCCVYLDKNFGHLLLTDSFFTLNYLQTYPFLSKSVHGLPTSIENTKRIKGRGVFDNYQVYAHTRDHNISFLFHTITAYLNSLCIVGLATKNEIYFKKYQSLLARHFNLWTNSLEKRNEFIKKNGIEKRKC